MSWQELLPYFRALKEAVAEGEPLQEPWEAFQQAVQRTSGNPPYHLRGLLKVVGTYSEGRPKSEIVILDHGCGAGFSLLYLCALGYTNVLGVDIPSTACDRWNTLFRTLFKEDKDRFFRYSGEALPFDDRTVDVVFSQQVVEHVEQAVFENYYQEEGRVLKPGGIAFHTVPHRLVPFDSHTKTWLLHWFLPRGMWLGALRMLGRDTSSVETSLFLRWPWRHFDQARRAFGHVDDVTLMRLQDLTDLDYYDGPKRLRGALTRAVALPVIGTALGATISKFVMRDTLSRKVAR
ncbi:class I SAM-dependent methyltransferase [Hwanghaeella grinnelliae]|uniref:Class I SAM-dependent methyltransferase n=1 Tax=Hwanghaeella grinnelliae TaxID=2500179 RepID=A0A437QQJ5_9PROT|nr:class I SAM-dependent methyltransferase [Hwanghaeella grinnelliae]RVU36772.1 class I SAM-dependent methyltransferase [Hwanghaeella grinnelliae]